MYRPLSAATVGNTTAINITGPAASATDELVDERARVPTALRSRASWGKINWTVNLGDNSGAGPRDTFSVDNSGNTDAGYETDWGANGVDLNGDGDLDVVLAGIETSQDFTGIGKVYPAAGDDGQRRRQHRHRCGLSDRDRRSTATPWSRRRQRHDAHRRRR